MIAEGNSYRFSKGTGILSRGASKTASFIQRRKEEGLQHLATSYSLRSGIKEALVELSKIALECRDANWDGYGAKAVSRAALGEAARFIGALPLGVRAPSVGIEPDGHVTLEWYRSRQYLLSISVGQEGYLHYAALLGLSKSYGTEPFFGEVPNNILELIARVESPQLQSAA